MSKATLYSCFGLMAFGIVAGIISAGFIAMGAIGMSDAKAATPTVSDFRSKQLPNAGPCQVFFYENTGYAKSAYITVCPTGYTSNTERL